MMRLRRVTIMALLAAVLVVSVSAGLVLAVLEGSTSGQGGESANSGPETDLDDLPGGHAVGGASPLQNDRADVVPDGVIDVRDLAEVAKNLGRTLDTPPPPTPTPTSTPTLTPTPTSPPPTPTPPTIRSDIVGFTLEDLTIPVGARVIWTQRDSGTVHTSTSGVSPDPDGIWDTGFLSFGESGAAILFDTVGSFPYFCRVHPSSMTATVTVTPLWVPSPIFLSPS